MSKATANAKTKPVEVRLDLGEEVYFLVPTLSAIKKINRQFGNLQNCFTKLRGMDFVSMVYIAQVGSDARGDYGKELENQIYRAGLAEAIGPLIEYVGILINGGRPLEDAPIDRDDDEGGPEGKG